MGATPGCASLLCPFTDIEVQSLGSFCSQWIGIVDSGGGNVRLFSKTLELALGGHCAAWEEA